ncbi:MAG TPA: Gfo/Idh/MocA family oxidoreductase [Candidatus Hydrogenedentes bacterium]|nr:Gfo/Idh/MocA family oxidoreductase [Candidatus Hydrogenedentota bacterium]
MRRLRIGFVGLGGIARSRHMPGLRRIEGVEVVAVSNRTRESSERAAREFGIPDICSSWEELVARDDLDAVFVGTWPYMHRPVSVAALEQGKHVFCQARLAMDFDDARAMCDAARRSGRVAMVCPVPFGLSVDATVARLLRDDAIGAVRLVRAQGMSDAYADSAAPMNWRKDHRLSGLNMGSLGMYIELIHRWFGWTRDLVATMQTFTLDRADALGARFPVRIPDQVMFLATLETGVPVECVISTCVLHGEDRVEIYGSKGTLRYDVGLDRLFLAGMDGAWDPVIPEPGEAYDVRQWRVEQDFIDAIREGKDYHPSFEDGLRYMQVIQAIYDAAASGRAVSTVERM